MEQSPPYLNLPPPGASPTVSGIAPLSELVGRYAEASIAIGAGSSIVLVKLHEWEANINFDFADVTAFGDAWKVYTFTDADWTARGRGYIVPGSPSHYLKSYTSSNVPTGLTFTGWSGATGVGAAQFAGACSIMRFRMSAPQQGLAEQEVEFRGSGIPSIGLS